MCMISRAKFTVFEAVKIGGAKCIEVKWNKVESGACYAKYKVVLKSASGSTV